MLPKLAYLALCGSIQLLTQLGRSHAAKDLEILEENPAGYQRIQRRTPTLGKRVSATAIRATLRRRRLDPAPRPASTTRRAFLRQEAAEIVACDFFTVDIPSVCSHG